MALSSDTYDTDAVYSGYVDKDFSSDDRVPDGWTVSRLGGDLYGVAHNLNLADWRVMRVTVTATDKSPPYIDGIDVDGFVVKSKKSFFFIAIQV